MFFMYVLGTVFMICTGFALYGEGLGMESWAFKLFTSWVLPLLGYSQNVHTLHHLGMWYLIVFTIVHLYMVVREDICSRRDRHQHDDQRLAGGQEMNDPAGPGGACGSGASGRRAGAGHRQRAVGRRGFRRARRRGAAPALARCRPTCRVVDGGTQGLYLLDHVCSADRVLVLDAIDLQLAPGHAARVPRRRGAGVVRHR